MNTTYTSEKNHLILISLLKSFGIKNVIVSPGATNVSFVASIQQDNYFNKFSCVDERSAAYMACGLAEETGEPVVISCTGATASRNYMPGLTEAFYKKLPVLAITSSHRNEHVGHLIPQVTNRDQLPADIVNFHVTLPVVESDEKQWFCEIKANEAILALFKRGGGPVHINLETSYSQDFTTKVLPEIKQINRYERPENLPSLGNSVAVFIGSHPYMDKDLVNSIDKFCKNNNGVVFHDHTSGYTGRFGVQSPLIGAQEKFQFNDFRYDTLIHIGQISGDYESQRLCQLSEQTWRVCADGELKDTFRNIINIFAINESDFFNYYSSKKDSSPELYLKFKELEGLVAQKFDNSLIPFSNLWIASVLAPKFPANSHVELSILNTLRVWNYFEFHKSVRSNCNVGGFGIDGQLSTLIGASLANPNKLYFGVMGDLAYFYDMNAQGNRHIKNNIRILLVNNGIGSEFTMYNHAGHIFGEDTNRFIAAEGHYGHKSKYLVKHFAEDLGFEYISASDKDEFLSKIDFFTQPEITPKPIFMEVFTNYQDESTALQYVRNLIETPTLKGFIKNLSKIFLVE